MKANRKFVHGEEAVSPVIAVILMVAITVVLAATVYVWVSGFGAATNQPARSIALDSNAPVSSSGQKEFTVTAASTGLKWQDLRFTLDGELLTRADNGLGTLTCDSSLVQGEFMPCGNSGTGYGIETDTMTVDGGDMLRLHARSGQTLRIVDSQANSVLMTVVIG